MCLIGFESMLWKVPIVIATKGNPQAASLVLTEQSTTVTLEGVGEGDWVLVSWGREGRRRKERGSRKVEEDWFGK